MFGTMLGKHIGCSGREYTVEKALRHDGPAGQVILASADNEKYVLKNIGQSGVDEVQALARSLTNCPFIRTPIDTIRVPASVVYHYFSDELLSLVQENLPLVMIKRILHDTLLGLAALHDQNIVHTDIKPDNILVDREGNNQSQVIKQVQLGDLESAAYVPHGSHIIGFQPGNWMWRSPEAHAKGPINKPSDMFSYGLVCMYAMHKRVLFAVGQEELSEGEEPLALVLERQISYFADWERLEGFLTYLGDNPWRDVFLVLRNGFNAQNPRKPFLLWGGVDTDFKHFVDGLCNLNPEKRLTAQQALNHAWWGK